MRQTQGSSLNFKVKLIFLFLFFIAQDRFISVASVFSSVNINLHFIKQLIGVYLQEWLALKQQFLSFTLDNTLEDKLH